MTINYQRAANYLTSLLEQHSLDELADRLRPDTRPLPERIPNRAEISTDAVAGRWKIIGADENVHDELLDRHTASRMTAYHHNIENFIGTVKLPVGIIGPLRVNGLFANGDYYVPLATTEAALVASYNRGAGILSAVGGASAMLLSEGVGRSPVFSFENFEQVGRFLEWAMGCKDAIAEIAESTSHHCKLLDIQINIEGNSVYFLLEFTTGDAAGQNMVTFATHAATKWIVEHSPVSPVSWYLEANFSGDKKATAQSFQRVRGRRVTAEATIPGALVERRLHTTPDVIVDCSRKATMGSVLSGAVGVQAHYANGLAALFVACGQDVACIAEAAVGTTRFEVSRRGDLYVAVTLPNLIVGTVGGATKLPSQRACLQLLRLEGANQARAFAEVAACVCLAGELSIIGAVCAGEFAGAHARLARGHDLD